jgi:hypothetical protein
LYLLVRWNDAAAIARRWRFGETRYNAALTPVLTVLAAATIMRAWRSVHAARDAA